MFDVYFERICLGLNMRNGEVKMGGDEIEAVKGRARETRARRELRVGTKRKIEKGIQI